MARKYRIFNAENKVHALEFATSQEAWEKLNEMFLRADPLIFDHDAYNSSAMAVAFNMYIRVRKAWVDPELDFGRLFNYTESKWTSLLNNYIDFNKLDLLRSKLRCFLRTNNQNYNMAYVFNNRHGNGKQCLLTAVFSRRLGDDIPTITMVLRSSEITKRLIFDFLLVQRMAEYIYGENKSFQVNIYAVQMYGNIETLLMYHTHKPLEKILKGVDKDTDWYKRVIEVFNKFKTSKPERFQNFKVFLRSFIVLRPDLYASSYKSMKAKDLLIEDDDIEYPENVISFSQRKAYKKKLMEKTKN